jgi:hypothetical protein
MFSAAVAGLSKFFTPNELCEIRENFCSEPKKDFSLDHLEGSQPPSEK